MSKREQDARCLGAQPQVLLGTVYSTELNSTVSSIMQFYTSYAVRSTCPVIYEIGFPLQLQCASRQIWCCNPRGNRELPNLPQRIALDIIRWPGPPSDVGPEKKKTGMSIVSVHGDWTAKPAEPSCASRIPRFLSVPHRAHLPTGGICLGVKIVED